MALPGRRLLLWVVALAALLALATPAATRWVLWKRELNPVLRGRLLAEREGCANCHDPHAQVEIPNPGSRWGSVPRFGAGNAMMYGATRSEIEQFIRHGAPRSWLDDPAVRRRLESQHLRMPGYESILSDDEIADLVQFTCAVEGVERAGGDEADAGREIARNHGCISCHGIEGSGGLPNPGSLGGFIPGFAGGNFPDLVQSESEFRQWVLEGTSPRLAANPVVRFFWRRQQISMPAYRGELSNRQIHLMWKWVQAVRAEGS